MSGVGWGYAETGSDDSGGGVGFRGEKDVLTPKGRPCVAEGVEIQVVVIVVLEVEGVASALLLISVLKA